MNITTRTKLWLGVTEEANYVSTTHLCSHDALYFSSVNSFNIIKHIVIMSHILILYQYMHILTIFFDQHKWPLLGTDNKLCIGSFF